MTRLRGAVVAKIRLHMDWCLWKSKKVCKGTLLYTINRVSLSCVPEKDLVRDKRRTFFPGILGCNVERKFRLSMCNGRKRGDTWGIKYFASIEERPL
jgi:hypothetical protein